jgi:hypothetical protein
VRHKRHAVREFGARNFVTFQRCLHCAIPPGIERTGCLSNEPRPWVATITILSPCRMFRLCLTRAPTSVERDVLMDYWREERERYRRDPAAARVLAPAERDDDASAAAAWTCIARVLLNTDEFVTRN